MSNLASRRLAASVDARR